MSGGKLGTALVCLSVISFVRPLVTQTVPALTFQPEHSPVSSDAEQTGHTLGLEASLKTLAELQSSRPCAAVASPVELSLRQSLSERIQAAALDVDSAIAEISNEQGQLSNLRTTLQMKRDKTVAKYNSAALITGSGASAAVSATQFTNLGSRTNNIGDGFGIGAGIASTILSTIASRKQSGPNGTVGRVPNMLAPLFDSKPTLSTFYPPVVLQFLNSVPADEDPARGTRLEQLKAEWVKSGRLASEDNSLRKTAPLTSSDNPDVKVTIQDLTDRIGMLVDVSGRISLMKRDLANLMRGIGGLDHCSARKAELE